ncbi:cytidine deaminase [Pollutibacter soli]|uniref:cytidine deaminase n=1 Tax=Pollutibacter soli TaxID=3034157 RepID=UPI003013FAFA
MEKKQKLIQYTSYTSIDELGKDDQWLLNEARSQTSLSYAPYSNYHVAAVARMDSGEIIHGTNQENASFPVGLCAERVLLAAVSSVCPGESIDTLAVSYDNHRDGSDHPVAPCGICRQSLAEFEDRMKHPVRLILSGMKGEVFVFESAKSLLPFAFEGTELR